MEVPRVAGGMPPAFIERTRPARSTSRPRSGVAGGMPPAFIERQSGGWLGSAARDGVAGGMPPAFIERVKAWRGGMAEVDRALRGACPPPSLSVPVEPPHRHQEEQALRGACPPPSLSAGLRPARPHSHHALRGACPPPSLSGGHRRGLPERRRRVAGGMPPAFIERSPRRRPAPPKVLALRGACPPPSLSGIMPAAFIFLGQVPEGSPLESADHRLSYPCTNMRLCEYPPRAGRRDVRPHSNDADRLRNESPCRRRGWARSERDLAHAAWSIVRDGDLAELSEPESILVHKLELEDRDAGDSRLIDLIRTGRDPLGDAFMRLRPPDQRRPLGATYTPPRSCPQWSPGLPSDHGRLAWSILGQAQRGSSWQRAALFPTPFSSVWRSTHWRRC